MNQKVLINVKQWKQRVQTERAKKDMFFASQPQSPLPAAVRSNFAGLAYWPLDSDHHFELRLHEHAEKTVQEVQDTGGQNRELLRWGLCVDAYPVDAIVLDAIAAIDAAKCTGCGQCVAECPQEALTLKKG